MSAQTNEIYRPGESEPIEISKYEKQLLEISEKAQSQIELEGAFNLVLEQSLIDADNGELRGTNKVYSAEELRAQFAEAASMLRGNVDYAGLNRIPRSGGLRGLIAQAVQTKEGRDAFVRWSETLGMSPEADVQPQSSVVEELGHAAVEQAFEHDIEDARIYSREEMAEIRAKLDARAAVEAAEQDVDPFDQLSATAKQEITDYRRTLINKREAERMQQYSAAGEYKDEAYALSRDMSPEAKEYLKSLDKK